MQMIPGYYLLLVKLDAMLVSYPSLKEDREDAFAQLLEHKVWG